MRFFLGVTSAVLVACSGHDMIVPDASPPDASVDVGSQLDALHDGPMPNGLDGPVDPLNEGGAAGSCEPPPNACAPESSAGFAPSWKPPAPHAPKCSTQMLDDLWAGCLAPDATQASCDSLTGANAPQANKDCLACLVTSSNAAAYGPIVAYPDYVWFNLPGCVALADPANEACARALQADDQCDAYACVRRCPITDDATYMTYLGCLQAADGLACACKSYGDATSCADAEAQGGPAKVCFTQGTDKQIYDAIAPLFCGQ
jgi:hypothetical protein